MPGLRLSAKSLSCIQKKPCATTSLASAARSLCCATSPSCLRNAAKLGSVLTLGSVTATALYGLTRRHRRRFEAARRHRHLLGLVLREAALGNQQQGGGNEESGGDHRATHRVISGWNLAQMTSGNAAPDKRELRPRCGGPPQLPTFYEHFHPGGKPCAVPTSSRNRRGAMRRSPAWRRPCRKIRSVHCPACRRDRRAPGISRSARRSRAPAASSGIAPTRRSRP